MSKEISRRKLLKLAAGGVGEIIGAYLTYSAFHSRGESKELEEQVKDKKNTGQKKTADSLINQSDKYTLYALGKGLPGVAIIFVSTGYLYKILKKRNPSTLAPSGKNPGRK